MNVGWGRKREENGKMEKEKDRRKRKQKNVEQRKRTQGMFILLICCQAFRMIPHLSWNFKPSVYIQFPLCIYIYKKNRTEKWINECIKRMKKKEERKKRERERLEKDEREMMWRRKGRERQLKIQMNVEGGERKKKGRREKEIEKRESRNDVK